jgi:hypothetical protein
MTERAFIIMQIGARESPERKRADEIYKFIIAPAVRDADLEPYRADQDVTPGPITPKFLLELLTARLVIADLTGRNPNVFYELGIAHSFARPLISIVDTVSSLPFDTKDERVIELGEYPSSGLTYANGEQAKFSLQESLKIVLADNYIPPSPLREVAANASVDQLAPENPLAAEMAQIRESLEEIRGKAGFLTGDDRNYLDEVLALSRRNLVDMTRLIHGPVSDAVLGLGSPEAVAPAPRSSGRSRTGLSFLLLPDLRQIAQTLGIPGVMRMRKSQLTEAIEARQVRPSS